nr:uncharacterized protein LOC111501837 [Leptinotarsa decemlineata]
MAEDICNSEIVVTDLQTANLAQLTIMTPVHMKKFVMILEKVYSNRVKQFHYVNCPSFAYSILTFLKSLMKPKLASRVYFHADSSKIGEILPLDLLPKDFGGSEISLYEMNELWKKKLAKNGDRFDALCKMKINEKLRPSPLVNDEILGFHGNFRKLEMD